MDGRSAPGPEEVNDYESFWMPFTANKAFKQSPRMFAEAHGVTLVDSEGRELIDSTAGLWCVMAGHRRRKIADAVADQIVKLDFAPTFQTGHPGPFKLASRLSALLPKQMNHVFFTNSGGEAVDTSLKIALAYHRVKGEGTRQRLIGRERAYHGTNFGGLSVAGIGPNRKQFGLMLPGVDHLRHTHDLEHMAFSRGQPDWGAHLADDLERLVQLHDASNIAAVIVEPVAGATGVLVPPKGYLERIREICDEHGILMILDEVITGFGRLGKPFAADYFGIVPDMITVAKGITNGTVPLGAVFVRDEIYEAFVEGTEKGIELFHGYTYSGHPVPCAAGLAALDIYEEEGLFTRAAGLAKHYEDAMHRLKDLDHVIDIRNLGLMGAVELEPRDGAPGERGGEVHRKAWEKGLYIRAVGDIMVTSPPLIITADEITRVFETLGDVIDSVS